MTTVHVVSLMAPNADATHEAIAAYVAARTGTRVRVVGKVAWPERERLFDAGLVQVGWMCGAYYVEKRDVNRADVQLLAAPVMARERYGGRPVYFSDVVVHRESPFREFSDLRRGSWAYNEPRSHSGYVITQHHLLQLGETSGFFARAIEAGSHQQALQMLLDRRVDGSAIDSTVLETELARSPELKDRIRIIASLGPSPIPPLVAWGHVDPGTRQMLSECLQSMHAEPAGRAVLQAGGIARFVPVRDEDYDPLRRMMREVSKVSLAEESRRIPA